MKITSAEKNKKYKDKLSIYVDGKFSFTISEEDYISLNLYEEQELTQETIDYIKNTLNYHEAKSRAVRYLSMKLRTEKEVRDKLSDEGYDDDCADKVVNELKAIGYINNQLYAQKYIFDRSKLKPISKRLMKKELVFRGISEETADEVLQDWKVEDSSVAESLLKRKFGKYDLNDKKILKKAMMFLTHRGFSSDTIREALRDYTADASDNDFTY
ncbi:MAG TPA: regulatory protein RecX [Clostridia bacterium]|nr:regulatory protein RecX [Clostridia bacterium]